MTKVFFTADCHFDHANIIKFTDRPFLKSGDLLGDGNGPRAERPWASDEIRRARVMWMNNTIIERWNKKVSPEDIVYHIGDFFLKRMDRPNIFENVLNGKIIHIRGNHDDNNGVKTYIDKCIMRFANKTVYVKHRPPRNLGEIPQKCDFVMCGHVHNAWKHAIKKDYPIINVGLDVWDFEPVSVDSILKYYWKIKNGVVDDE